MFIYEITDAFDEAGLKYVIVGGYALALHGIVRATMDVDLVLSLTLKDYELVEEILKKLNLNSRLPIRAQDVIKMREEYIKNRNLIAWSFVDYVNPTRQVDILITKDISEIHIQKINVAGRKIPVASLDDLLKMKSESNRPQDLLDIEKIKEKLYEKK